MAKPHNHPAFPVSPYAGDANTPAIRSNSGMSIRDYFAAAALTTLACDAKSDPEAIAEEAYAFADAMLIEREAR